MGPTPMQRYRATTREWSIPARTISFDKLLSNLQPEPLSILFTILSLRFYFANKEIITVPSLSLIVTSHEFRVISYRLVTRLSDARNQLIKSVEKRSRSIRVALSPIRISTCLHNYVCTPRSPCRDARPTDFHQTLGASPVHTVASK